MKTTRHKNPNPPRPQATFPTAVTVQTLCQPPQMTGNNKLQDIAIISTCRKRVVISSQQSKEKPTNLLESNE